MLLWAHNKQGKFYKRQTEKSPKPLAKSNLGDSGINDIPIAKIIAMIIGNTAAHLHIVKRPIRKATKIPMTADNCCSEHRKPLNFGDDISEM